MERETSAKPCIELCDVASCLHGKPHFSLQVWLKEHEVFEADLLHHDARCMEIENEGESLIVVEIMTKEKLDDSAGSSTRCEAYIHIQR